MLGITDKNCKKSYNLLYTENKIASKLYTDSRYSKTFGQKCPVDPVKEFSQPSSFQV